MTIESPQADAYLRNPNENDDTILHPLQTTQRRDSKWTVMTLEPGLAIDPETELLIYFDVRQQFMKQSAIVTSVEMHENDHLTVELELVGEPMSAENRQCYRVCTAVGELVMTFAGETDCAIVDISATGCAVVSSVPHQVGALLQASISFKGKLHEGQVAVQSLRAYRGKRYRYGLHCIEDRGNRSDLAKALQQLGMQVQREQLQRLSGAA